MRPVRIAWTPCRQRRELGIHAFISCSAKAARGAFVVQAASVFERLPDTVSVAGRDSHLSVVMKLLSQVSEGYAAACA